MGMGSLLGAILGTILNYKGTPMSTVKSPLIRVTSTEAHIPSLDRILLAFDA